MLTLLIISTVALITGVPTAEAAGADPAMLAAERAFVQAVTERHVQTGDP